MKARTNRKRVARILARQYGAYWSLDRRIRRIAQRAGPPWWELQPYQARILAALAGPPRCALDSTLQNDIPPTKIPVFPRRMGKSTFLRLQFPAVGTKPAKVEVHAIDEIYEVTPGVGGVARSIFKSDPGVEGVARSNLDSLYDTPKPTWFIVPDTDDSSSTK